MSHELRTPLNSLLILSNLLSQNAEGNLSAKQVEFARTIHSSGSDLLTLINEILDLAKIESGTMEVDIRRVPFADLRDYVERNFRQVAEDRGLAFDIELDAGLPESIATDPQRLQQVLRNLLSNAFKFTERGRCDPEDRPSVSRAGEPALDVLNRADAVIAFAVTDTGIGIPAEKHKIIFEAFQQADGTTSRKYGGHGPGSLDQPGDRRAAGRRDPVDQQPGPGQHVHALPAADLHARRRRWQRRPRGAPGP